MIKAVIFDLDNTLLDFIKMKQFAVQAAISSMVEAGLEVDEGEACKNIFRMYEEGGWENQSIFNDFLDKEIGSVDHKLLAAGIVAYRRAREASLQLYPNVNKTLFELLKMGIKLAVVSDAPSREAWMRIYYLNLHHVFDLVLTIDDTGARKPSSKPFAMALESLKIKAGDAIMVGDWPERDIKGAKQFGMKTAFAKYGSTEIIDNSGADYELDVIHELVDIIKTENDIL